MSLGQRSIGIQPGDCLDLGSVTLLTLSLDVAVGVPDLCVDSLVVGLHKLIITVMVGCLGRSEEVLKVILDHMTFETGMLAMLDLEHLEGLLVDTENLLPVLTELSLNTRPVDFRNVGAMASSASSGSLAASFWSISGENIRRISFPVNC